MSPDYFYNKTKEEQEPKNAGALFSGFRDGGAGQSLHLGAGMGLVRFLLDTGSLGCGHHVRPWVAFAEVAGRSLPV